MLVCELGRASKDVVAEHLYSLASLVAEINYMVDP
jgi:hypothetical protein